MGNLHLESRSRKRPCLSCGQQFRRKLQHCPNCGAEKGKSEVTEINAPFRELIPDGLEVYITHLNEYGRIDFGGWNHSLHKNDNSEVVSMMEPYLKEIYSASKALFIGYSLWDSGITKYDEWCKQLRQQVSPEEIWTAKVSTRWLYESVRKGMEDSSSDKVEGDVHTLAKTGMNRMQRISILTGIGLILVMLTVPPWMSRNGGFRGYYFILAPPFPTSVVDSTRLLIQCAFVVLLTGGVVFAMQDYGSKNKK